MRVFERNDKHNFVDVNNVYVGYDSGQLCCEHANWFISDNDTPEKTYDCEDPYDCEAFDRSTIDKLKYKSEQEISLLDKYVFDVHYFKEVKLKELNCNLAIFKLNCDNLPSLYLYLFNCHNGYYSHGFEMKITDEYSEEFGKSTTSSLGTFLSKSEIREGNL